MGSYSFWLYDILLKGHVHLEAMCFLQIILTSVFLFMILCCRCLVWAVQNTVVMKVDFIACVQICIYEGLSLFIFLNFCIKVFIFKSLCWVGVSQNMFFCGILSLIYFSFEWFLCCSSNLVASDWADERQCNSDFIRYLAMYWSEMECWNKSFTSQCFSEI